jgi:Animal haem peroxidase
MPKIMSHGARPLRGLENTAQSTIEGQSKFGRMFRWLEPAQKASNPEEAKELRELMEAIAAQMVTNEFAENIAGHKFKDRLAALGVKNPQNTPDAPLVLAEPDDENETIPAGYTYFGQFVDHDITFDPASHLQQVNDPDAIVDFRTPRLDLDNVYGRGPDDQPYLYEKKSSRLKRLKIGNSVGAVNGEERHDVPRDSTDKTALIGDKRNDENKIIAQIQVLFLKLHNKIYDKLGPRYLDSDGIEQHSDERFSEAQRITRWCYQFVVLTDYVKKICDEAVYEKIKPAKNNHHGPNLQFYKAHGDGFIPVEFAVAAFRFGHSMVRPSYALSDSLQTGSASFDNGIPYGRIPIFIVKQDMTQVLATDAMNGFGQPIPPGWGIDWSFFFGDFKSIPDGQRQVPQPSYRIDTKLVDPLGKLPEFFDPSKPSFIASLAARNLMRGVSMGLPSGQRIARMMGHEPLSDAELWNKRNNGDMSTPWADGAALLENHKKWLQGSAPLWFYILKEAELRKRKKKMVKGLDGVEKTIELSDRESFSNGRKLGFVGSTIVAETFFGLAWADHYSYLYQEPDWDPSKEHIAGLPHDLDMLKLANFVG